MAQIPLWHHRSRTILPSGRSEASPQLDQDFRSALTHRRRPSQRLSQFALPKRMAGTRASRRQLSMQRHAVEQTRKQERALTRPRAPITAPVSGSFASRSSRLLSSSTSFTSSIAMHPYRCSSRSNDGSFRTTSAEPTRQVPEGSTSRGMIGA
jgi:hypothetical protein